MKKNAIILIPFLIILVAAWAPWMDNQAIHDHVLHEKGRKDGTVIPIEEFERKATNITELHLEYLIEESRRNGVEDGILICDYNVMWAPFGRWVASCEGGYFITFYEGGLPR